MKEQEKIRKEVSEAYSKAVSSSGGGCCSPTPAQKGAMAKLAGYTREDLEALPAEAVINSFGCGNPLAYSEVKEGDVVLDLGSGAGIDLLIAAKKVGPKGRAIGIDMTDDMIAKAKENIATAGLTNAEVRKGIIENLPVESSSVDWVISNCVINLSPEKNKVFAEIARVLKPGGRMLVSDIVAKDLPDYIRRNKTLYCSCIAGAISEEEYLRGLSDAGLADIKVLDRLIYDTPQLKAFVASETSDQGESGCGCGCVRVSDEEIGQIAEIMTAKVWSAKFQARKPQKTGG
jgi:SAM-dependent methyltransferase